MTTTISDGAKLVETPVTPSGTEIGLPDEAPYAWHVVDYNNDGYQDVIAIKSGNWCVYLSTGSQLSSQCQSLGFSSAYANTSMLADFNGDGLPDLVYQKSQGEFTIRYMESYSSGGVILNRFGNETTVSLPLVWNNPVGSSLSFDTIFYYPESVYQYHTPSSDVEIKYSDFNGDGRVDALVRLRFNLECSEYYEYSWGLVRDCTSEPYLGVYIANENGNYNLDHVFQLPGTDIISEPSPDFPVVPPFPQVDWVGEPVDINNDGFVDVVLKNDTDKKWDIYLNNGRDFVYQQTLSTPSNSRLIRFVDYNQDGYNDILAPNGSTLQAILFNPNTETFDTSSPVSTDIPYTCDACDAYYFIDIDADGHTDSLYLHQSHPGDNSNGNIDQEIRKSNSVGKVTNVITAIDNGMGNVTTLTYKNLSDSTVYAKENTANLNTWDLPSGHNNLGKPYPVFDLGAPMYVVAKAESNSPTATGTPGSVNYAATSSISYFYEGLKIQAAGRGGLGFHKVTSTDNQSGVSTTTTYRQDFPFIGYPLKTEVRSAQGNLLSESESKWDLEHWNGGNPSAPYHPFLAQSVEKTYDLESNGASQGSLLKSVTTTTLYDDYDMSAGSLDETDTTALYGNVAKIVVTTRDGSGNVVATDITENTYGHSDWEKRMGRLSRTTVTHIQGSESVERISSFTYYTSGIHKGLLQTEEVEPDDSALTIKSTYEYDSFGNKEKLTQTGGIENRITETLYDDTEGRYIVSTKNAYGQVTHTVVSRNSLGQPTVVKDINEVETHFAYGKWGRRYFEASETGAYSQTLLSACDINCPTGAQYYSTTVEAGGGESVEYFDVLGRSIRVSKRQFDGTWGHVDTEYDNQGRVKRKSEPHNGAAVYWTELDYDILGRVTSTALPGVTLPITVTYKGFTTTTTNPALQSKKETFNVLGQLVDVYDNDNGQIQYHYDVQGNLRSVVNKGSPEDPQSVEVEMCYDKLGRKIAMSDPDKGGWLQGANTECPSATTTQPVSGWWLYRYNNFGELKLQIDAKGQTSELSYDLLGRLVNRIDKKAGGVIEGNTTWTYNNATTGSARGALLGVDDSISTYTRIYGHDTFGRVEETITSFGSGEDHYEKVTFDQYGRTFQVFDAAGDGTWQDNAIQNIYNAYGYLEKVKDAVIENGAQTHYYTVEQMDLRGNVIEYQSGNGVTSTRSFDPATGRLLTQRADGVGMENVQDLSYTWDEIGNLLSRHDQSGSKNLTENFTEYDGLNRLKTYQVVGQTAKTVQYNSLGNIISKSDVGTYQYGAECTSGFGPHAVCETSGMLNATYTYDANGNMTGGDGRTLTYTTFDKPDYIDKGDHTTTFKYGPDRARYLRTDTDSGGTTTTRYIGNVEKIVKPDGSKEIKRYLPGGALITISLDSGGAETGETTQYLYKDHLGSIDVITDAVGTVVQQMSFDAWGQRRAAIDWSNLDVASLLNFDHSITTQGFTGHEMLDEVGLIHMNGRVYEPKLGRFLQADPFIQAASNTQSYNRYAYVFNNPLSYTDPSGYFSLGHKGHQNFGFIKVVLAVVAQISPCVCGAYVYAALSAGETYRYSGNIGKSIAVGVLSYYAFSQMPASFEWGNFLSTAKLLEIARTLVVNGTIGGVTAELQGGKFGHGFISAGIGSIIPGGKGFTGFVTKLVVGGTISELTGGKFANGAAYAAFSAAVHALAPQDSSTEKLGPERFSQEQQDQINKEISLAADVEAVNKKGFDNSGDAAVYLRKKLQPIAEKYDIEIGAYIPKVGDNYIIQDVQTTFHSGTVLSMADTRLGVDWFHTHQNDHGTFSYNDFSKSRIAGATGYLSDRSGLYRFRAYDYGVARVQANGQYKVDIQNYLEKYSSSDGRWY